MRDKPKQIHLAVVYSVGSNHNLWTRSQPGTHIDFSSFTHLAQTAERGKFDFFFLTELLRLREKGPRAIEDHEVAGSPNIMAILAGLAAVTTHLGLVATDNATFNEPYDLARQIASLDHLSGGRVGWNVVTTNVDWVGENFRRGGYLDYGDRYLRAGEFLDVARRLWESWAEDAVEADVARGVFVRDDAIETVAYHGKQFDISGQFTLPRSPQVHPVLLWAGNSSEGREIAAAQADMVFCKERDLEDGQAFYADVKRRLARYGRAWDDLKIMPGASYVLGDTEEEARERAEHIRREQVSPQTAIAFLEQIWGQDLSGYDPDGPLPDVKPADPAARATVSKLRAEAKQHHLSIRDLAVELTSSKTGVFVGTASQVADQMNEYVQRDASDGFVLAPFVQPTGLDEFVDRVVPELQERGVFRSDYESTRLRDHLGLPPARTAGSQTAPPQTTKGAFDAPGRQRPSP